MKLCLVGDENLLIERWEKALDDLHPRIHKKLYDGIGTECIVIISEKMIERLEEAELKHLFGDRIMVLSITPNFMNAQKYLRLGAMGYGNAMMHESHLRSAVQAIQEGKVWLHPDFISMLIMKVRQNAVSERSSEERLIGLSKREKDVALMLGEGATHQQIADALGITVRTVKAHATAIYQKLGVKDRLELSLYLHS